MILLYRGRISLDASHCPLYESSRTVEKSWPAQRSGSLREASLLNKCQTASFASYYVFLGARLEPHASPEFKLRLAIPDEPGFAEELPAALPEDLPQPLPRAVLTLERGRYHPVDTREWALKLAVRQLLRILVTEEDWPPASPLIEEFSQEWSSGKYR